MILWTCILEWAQTLVLFINSIITIWLILPSRGLWPAEPRLAFGLFRLAMFAGNSVSLFHRLVCILGPMSPFLITELLKLCPHMSSRGCRSYSSRVTTPESWLATLVSWILWQVLLRGPASGSTAAWQSGAWFHDFVFMDPDSRQEILFDVLTVLCCTCWFWFLSQG